MTATAALLIVVLVWLAIGVVCAFVMARRGHDPGDWGALGALWGPLVVPIALSRSREDRSVRSWQRVERAGSSGGGPVDALVGIDGSPDAIAAALAVRRLLGGRLGRLTLAAVVDYDVVEAAGATAPATAAAHDALECAVEALGAGLTPETIILTGRPGPELLDHAVSNDFELIAVGARGRGVSRAFIGHVSSLLVRQRDVPVLVAGLAEVS